MRCRKHHPEDLTSTIGVCASCLSDRLLTIIAAQEKAHQARASSRASPTPPPPLAFPRSVSPYVSRRKSDHATWHTLDNTNTNNNLFYSTPQLGPTGSYPQPAHTGLSSGRTKKNKFWVLSSLFRSRSDDIKLGPHEPNEPSSSSSSSSWFSTIFTNRKKNIHHDDDHVDHRRSQYRPSDRGMSPVTNESSSVVDCDGCSAETSPRWRKTPNGNNGNSNNRARRSRHVSHVSGMAFCLSPLVRASPNSNSHWKGMMPSPSEMVSEVRGKPKAKVKGMSMTQSHPQHRPHLSTASSFCANRSRKLADFGRANHVR